VRPTLIHLNGPPGIGKSTIARLYAEEHPGVLNLDIDLLRGLIGGSRDRFGETGRIIRPIALAMARAQLAQGLDVVLPQYLGVETEVVRFETAAHESGAVFHEIVLMDTKQRLLERFERRDGTDWDREVRAVVARQGGPVVLERAHDRLTALLASRPQATVIRTGTIQQTYRAVLSSTRAAGS
jgi:predicted kinase